MKEKAVGLIDSELVTRSQDIVVIETDATDIH